MITTSPGSMPGSSSAIPRNGIFCTFCIPLSMCTSKISFSIKYSMSESLEYSVVGAGELSLQICVILEFCLIFTLSWFFSWSPIYLDQLFSLCSHCTCPCSTTILLRLHILDIVIEFVVPWGPYVEFLLKNTNMISINEGGSFAIYIRNDEKKWPHKYIPCTPDPRQPEHLTGFPWPPFPSHFLHITCLWIASFLVFPLYKSSSVTRSSWPTSWPLLGPWLRCPPPKKHILPQKFATWKLTKRWAPAKKHGENIISTKAWPTTSFLQSFESKSIILSPFLFVGKNFISSRDF